MKPSIVTQLPGPKSYPKLRLVQKLNGSPFTPYPYVHSCKGEGAYFKDIDGNTFLDFASQIAVAPLGYDHPDLKDVHKRFSQSPVKYAGQDFIVEEHIEMLKELLSITPRSMNAAFLINSGAEAVENAIKVCMRSRPATKFGVSFDHAFHGRTLGALSCTNSKAVQKKNYLSIPMRRLPFNISAAQELETMVEDEGGADAIGFVIVEPVQGEGGYHVAEKTMMTSLRKVTKKHRIPLVCDEVQAGLGRTGRWWSHQNFGITPEVMSSAKALQVGATIANKKFFPKEEGAISSTWGGGSQVDLAVGAQMIRTIKKRKLLNNVKKQGKYLGKRLDELEEKHEKFMNARGLGLMRAFDVTTSSFRNTLIIECLKRGLVLLGCGISGVRLIPPYIVKHEQIDQAVEIIEDAFKCCIGRGYKHSDQLCKFMGCSEHSI